MGSRIQARLTIQEYNLILENCCADLFATDGRGKIIYANDDSVKVLCCSLEKLLTMDIYQLRAEGYVSYSMTDEVLRTRRQAMGTYFNKEGQEIACVSTPVFDDNENLCMVVTYSRQLDVLETFQKELRQEREKLKGYQAAMDMMGYHGEDQIVANDPSTRKVFASLEALARMDSTIMLYGESGVGKEVAANFIRRHSARKDAVFVPVNCAAIPNELIESELFGYEKGAFTGALKEGRAGLFEIANGGTIFMDEVGELPQAAQAKLLRVLESGEFRRIGGSAVQKTDVRIIAATNRNLKRMVVEKLFREDLYYRLNVVPVTIPPLRERLEDLEALACVFLNQFNRKHGKSRILSAQELVELKAYRWPGNIRELRNVMERFVLTGEFSTWEREIVIRAEERNPPAEEFQSLQRPLKQMLLETESHYIRQVLEQNGGDVDKTAAVLQISRSGLYKKLQREKGGGAAN